MLILYFNFSLFGLLLGFLFFYLFNVFSLFVLLSLFLNLLIFCFSSDRLWLGLF